MAARIASQPDPEAFASRMESALVAQIGAARFQMWFGASRVLFVPGQGEAIVAFASEEFQKWLEPTFGAAIRAAAPVPGESPHKVRRAAGSLHIAAQSWRPPVQSGCAGRR